MTLGQTHSFSPGKETMANYFQKNLPGKLQGLIWAVARSQRWLKGIKKLTENFVLSSNQKQTGHARSQNALYYQNIPGMWCANLCYLNISQGQWGNIVPHTVNQQSEPDLKRYLKQHNTLQHCKITHLFY